MYFLLCQIQIIHHSLHYLPSFRNMEDDFETMIKKYLDTSHFINPHWN